MAQRGGRCEWFYDKERCAERLVEAYKLAAEQTDSRAAEPAQATPTAPGSDEAGAAEVNGVADEVRVVFGGNGGGNSAGGRPRDGRPRLRRGVPIEEYPMGQLVALARWIDSGEELYTSEELIREMMRELGFRRLGHKIEARLRAAIQEARG